MAEEKNEIKKAWEALKAEERAADFVANTKLVVPQGEENSPKLSWMLMDEVGQMEIPKLSTHQKLMLRGGGNVGPNGEEYDQDGKMVWPEEGDRLFKQKPVPRWLLVAWILGMASMIYMIVKHLIVL